MPRAVSQRLSQESRNYELYCKVLFFLQLRIRYGTVVRDGEVKDLKDWKGNLGLKESPKTHSEKPRMTSHESKHTELLDKSPGAAHRSRVQCLVGATPWYQGQ